MKGANRHRLDGSSRAFAVGDIHGRLDAAVDLLRRHGFIDVNRRWLAGRSTLWFLGDYVDRGPDGIGVIEFVMELQNQARSAGGQVGALAGNHDLLLLAAHRFGDRVSDVAGRTFRSMWQMNGGNPADMARLSREHVRWLEHLVPIAVERGNLLLHADSDFYRDYGRTVAGTNRKIQGIVRGADPAEWTPLTRAFTRRREFDDSDPDGIARATVLLMTYQARRIVHGHTPIRGNPSATLGPITEPLEYADGLCVNIDGGLFMGEPGIVYELCTL
jgi:hypothetical protein